MKKTLQKVTAEDLERIGGGYKTNEKYFSDAGQLSTLTLELDDDEAKWFQDNGYVLEGATIEKQHSSRGEESVMLKYPSIRYPHSGMSVWSEPLSFDEIQNMLDKANLDGRIS